ncbi:MAG: hypothetical protein AAGN15_03365 [Cyanobacteria bacterium J06581_3]
MQKRPDKISSSDFPKLLLISELSLSKSSEGRSANPTLYNLFKTYPPESLLQLVPNNTLKLSPPVAPHQNVVSYSDSFFPLIRNRIGLTLNRYFIFLNLSILNLLNLSHREKIEEFSPDLLLLCPITLSSLIVGWKMANKLKIPFLIYFMDDWIAVDQSLWIGGDTQSLASYLLQESKGWIMISDYMQEDISQRLGINGKPYIVAHNPVEPLTLGPNNKESTREKFRIAYAGSIQTMHSDALLLVAEATHYLRKEGIDIELVIYTASSFWENHQESLIKFEVQYGSLLPYDELLSKLSEFDLLLVCTSFSPHVKHVVRSSLLTKLTDYMATGRPILSCGPSYSACNRFLEKWNCGVVCDHNSILEIKKVLKKCIYETEVLLNMADKASTVLKENFSGAVVTKRLHEFIIQVDACTKSDL